MKCAMRLAVAHHAPRRRRAIAVVQQSHTAAGIQRVHVCGASTLVASCWTAGSTVACVGATKGRATGVRRWAGKLADAARSQRMLHAALSFSATANATKIGIAAVTNATAVAAMGIVHLVGPHATG